MFEKKSYCLYWFLCCVEIIFTNYCHTKSWQYVQYLTYDHALFTKLFSFVLFSREEDYPLPPSILFICIYWQCLIFTRDSSLNADPSLYVNIIGFVKHHLAYLFVYHLLNILLLKKNLRNWNMNYHKPVTT